jgi:Bacterial SH3 domain
VRSRHEAIRHGRRRSGIVALAAVSALAAGCGEEPKKAAEPALDRAGHARQVAEQGLRSGASGAAGVELRGVQVYPQAMPRQIAVCGQVSRSRANAFTFFVSVVSYDDGSASSAPTFHIDQFVAETIDSATRVWTEMIGHCYENGGPQPGRRPSIQTLPPMPNLSPPQAVPADAPRMQAPEVKETPILREPSAAREPPVARTGASGTVTARQNANLHATPGSGEVLRVVPRNTALRVFGQAPGGWYQVGDAEPQGWIHRSMVDLQP